MTRRMKHIVEILKTKDGAGIIWLDNESNKGMHPALTWGRGKNVHVEKVTRPMLERMVKLGILKGIAERPACAPASEPDEWVLASTITKVSA